MSKLQNWGTPQYVFDYFNSIHRYNLDLCAEPWSAKLPSYCSLGGRNAFKASMVGARAWCNPPYDDIEPWIDIATTEPFYNPDLITFLLPARTDRPWFHRVAGSCLVQFIAGRLKFVPPPGWEGSIDPDTGKVRKATSCEFPVMALTFNNNLTLTGWETLEIPRPPKTRIKSAA